MHISFPDRIPHLRRSIKLYLISIPIGYGEWLDNCLFTIHRNWNGTDIKILDPQEFGNDFFIMLGVRVMIVTQG
jgi:hypothetical protein